MWELNSTLSVELPHIYRYSSGQKTTLRVKFDTLSVRLPLQMYCKRITFSSDQTSTPYVLNFTLWELNWLFDMHYGWRRAYLSGRLVRELNSTLSVQLTLHMWEAHIPLSRNSTMRVKFDTLSVELALQHELCRRWAYSSGQAVCCGIMWMNDSDTSGSQKLADDERLKSSIIS